MNRVNGITTLAILKAVRRLEKIAKYCNRHIQKTQEILNQIYEIPFSLLKIEMMDFTKVCDALTLIKCLSSNKSIFYLCDKISGKMQGITSSLRNFDSGYIDISKRLKDFTAKEKHILLKNYLRGKLDITKVQTKQEYNALNIKKPRAISNPNKKPKVEVTKRVTKPKIEKLLPRPLTKKEVKPPKEKIVPPPSVKIPKPKEIKPKETKLKEIKPKEIKLKEIKPKEIKLKEIKPKEIKLKEIKPKEIKAKEIKPKEIKPKEIKAKEIQPMEIKPEEIKPKEIKLKEIKAKEIKPKEIKPKEIKLKEIKPKEIKPKEIKAKEIKPKEIKPKEIQPMEIKPEEFKPKEIKPKETKSKEIKPKETKTKEIKPKETKAKETKKKEIKPKEVKPKEVKPKEVKLKEIKPKEIKEKEIKPMEIKPKEIKAKEIKPMEIKPKEIKAKEIKPMEIKPKEIKPKEIEPMEIEPMEIEPMEIQLQENPQKKIVTESANTDPQFSGKTKKRVSRIDGPSKENTIELTRAQMLKFSNKSKENPSEKRKLQAAKNPFKCSMNPFKKCIKQTKKGSVVGGRVMKNIQNTQQKTKAVPIIPPNLISNAEGLLPFRITSRTKLFEAITSKDIPDGCNPEDKAKALEEAIYSAYEKHSFRYAAAVRSRIHNLADKSNTHLHQRFVAGTLSAAELAVMSHDEMASEKLKIIRESYKKQNLNAVKYSPARESTNSLIKCYNCRSYNCVYDQLQTRSADEPMTTFAECLDCGKRMRF